MKPAALWIGLLSFGSLCAQTTPLQHEMTVYFDSGLSTLQADDAETITAFFTADSIDIQQIAVRGFCDDVGANDDNQLLSTARAETVAQYISKIGDNPVTEVSGKGEIALTGNAGIDTQRQHNRRAVVNVVYLPKAKKNATETPKNPSPKKEKASTVDRYEGYKTLEEKLTPGDKLILRRLIFIGSTTVFEDPEEAEGELMEIVAYLKQNPTYRFEIQGHVCCISNAFRDARDIYTGKNNLSEARAKRIYDYFIEKGIDPTRMTYQGFGRKFPRPGVAEDLNKRVEIVITSN